MQVSEAMVPMENLITAAPTITVLDAMDILVVNRIGSVVIVDRHESVTGILTARDLMQAAVVHGKMGLQIQIKDIMSTKLLTVNENDQLSTAVKKMDEFQTHHILVKDNGGRICGILSSFDIVRETALNSLKI